jgi:DNA (cytosine-5)-methyltransferase 1
MKFLSVCSGIEAASVAWNPLGWKAVAFSEIEPFPCNLLKHHYPETPNLGDMTKFKEWPDVSIDLLCGGTPCQSFSVAGLRKGLDDPRGNLMLTFGAIAAKYRPKWLVWENVPGVLSSNGGADFGAFLGMLGQLGYGFAYRVLDAQYFGVAQRRRRVFVVGCLGDWRSAAAVLFERHSLQGHPAPSREARKVAPTIPSRSTGGGGLGTDFDLDGGTICVATGQAGAEIGAEIGADMAPTLNCNHEAPYALYATSQYGEVAGALTARHDSSACADRGQNIVAGAICRNSFSGGAGGRPEGAAAGHFVPVAFPANLSATQHASTEDLAPSMGASNPTAVAFNMHKSGNQASSMGVSEDRTDCLRAFEKSPFAVQPAAGMQVRRLTPAECEKLQGFPVGYTDIKPKGKPTADGPRYKALGNSWAVPNVRWIGERINAVAHIQLAQAAIENVAVMEVA